MECKLLVVCCELCGEDKDRETSECYVRCRKRLVRLLYSNVGGVAKEKEEHVLNTGNERKVGNLE